MVLVWAWCTPAQGPLPGLLGQNLPQQVFQLARFLEVNTKVLILHYADDISVE